MMIFSLMFTCLHFNRVHLFSCFFFIFFFPFVFLFPTALQSLANVVSKLLFDDMEEDCTDIGGGGDWSHVEL